MTLECDEGVRGATARARRARAGRIVRAYRIARSGARGRRSVWRCRAHRLRFIPLRWEDGGDCSASGQAAPGPRRRTSNIPANPDALALGVKSGAVAKADLQETVELLRALVGVELKDPLPLPSPLGEREKTNNHRGAGATSPQPSPREERGGKTAVKVHLRPGWRAGATGAAFPPFLGPCAVGFSHCY
jgi:hypothetical protein